MQSQKSDRTELPLSFGDLNSTLNSFQKSSELMLELSLVTQDWNQDPQDCVPFCRVWARKCASWITADYYQISVKCWNGTEVGLRSWNYLTCHWQGVLSFGGLPSFPCDSQFSSQNFKGMSGPWILHISLSLFQLHLTPLPPSPVASLRLTLLPLSFIF